MPTMVWPTRSPASQAFAPGSSPGAFRKLWPSAPAICGSNSCTRERRTKARRSRTSQKKPASNSTKWLSSPTTLSIFPAMRAGGFAIAVKNARAEVKHEAHYVTPHNGGDGALRDAVEFILKAQGKWKKAMEDYLAGRSGKHGN